MTFEEAKKILEKEGFIVEKVTRPRAISESFIELFIEYEGPTICEAMHVVNSVGYGINMEMGRFLDRKARLKKEYEENTKNFIKGNFSGNKSIEYCVDPMPGPGEEQPKEGNPALKEAASQFNDALLDEQAKKIKRLGKEIARLNGIIHDKNEVIADLGKELKVQKGLANHISGKYDGAKINLKLRMDECENWKKKLEENYAILADVSEELRLTKIREKNLTEVCQKYMKENEELKKELANKVVDKIDAQALKSAESALAWKEKTITYKDMALAYYEKKIAEKDEVIADLGNELAATKKELEEKTKRVEVVRNASKEYCEYGVAANEFIKKLANLYVIAGNKGTISNGMFERCKNYQTYGFPATCNKETKKEIDDIARGKENKKPRIHTPEISEEELMKIQEKVVASCDIAEEGGDYSATIMQCGNGITLSKEEAEIIERCTKNGTELHYSEKDGFTYTNVFDKEMPIRCLRGMFHVFTDEEIENMKK